MGHCCNYVVRAGGELKLYASNCGALSILRDFFWGLDASLAFLAAQEEVDPKDGWYDDVFGEGAIAIDRDERVVLVDGGEIFGPARALCIRLMRSIWNRDRFELREASFADVARHVGVPSEAVEAEHDVDPPLDVDDPASNGRAAKYVGCLVVAGPVVRCCRTDSSLLEAGPAILASLERLPTVAEAKSFREDLRWLDVVVVDAKQKVVRCKPSYLQRSTTRRHYEATWPGYRFDPATQEEARALLLGSGIDVAPEAPAPTIEQQIQEISQYVFGDSAGIARIVDDLEQRQKEGSWVNPRALKKPVEARPEGSRREIFEHACHDVLGRGQ